jgi:hypothetical protein
MILNDTLKEFNRVGMRPCTNLRNYLGIFLEALRIIRRFEPEEPHEHKSKASQLEPTSLENP